MNIYGMHLSQEDVLRKTGRIRQVFGSRRYILNQGAAKGTECVDVNCGEFAFTIVPDRGMDISLASYRGCNLAFQAAPGEVNPAYYDGCGSGSSNSFFAGLLTTCGLDNLSRPCADEGVNLGQHGRYSGIPAEVFNDLSRWEDGRYIMEFRGVVTQPLLLSHKLRLTRTISAVAGETRLFIADEIENFGSIRSPLMILYHVNAGFPLLDEGADIACSPHDARGYDEYSQERIAAMYEVSQPKPGFPEENFLLKMNTDKAYAKIMNKRLMNGISLYVNWESCELPYMTLWRSFQYSDYVMAAEPCNCPCRSRSLQRAEGTLPFIEPGEIKRFHLEIGVTAAQS